MIIVRDSTERTTGNKEELEYAYMGLLYLSSMEFFMTSLKTVTFLV